MSKRGVARIDMMRCRAYGHAWEDRGWLPMVGARTARREGSARLWDQLLTCTGCTSSRNDRRAWGTLSLEYRVYDMAPGYPSDVSKIDAIAECIAYDSEHGIMGQV